MMHTIQFTPLEAAITIATAAIVLLYALRTLHASLSGDVDPTRDAYPVYGDPKLYPARPARDGWSLRVYPHAEMPYWVCQASKGSRQVSAAFASYPTQQQRDNVLDCAAKIAQGVDTRDGGNSHE